MTKITSKAQASRTVQALAETTGLIAKERRYLPELQHAGYLAMLEQHAAKLLQMIIKYKQR
jgi:hypothetical protein